MKKGITSLLVGSALLIGTGTGALAATNMEKVTAYLNDQIKMEVNGSPATLQSSGGAEVTPLTYQGTTYLPVRATADLLGASVVYNAATSTIQVSTTTTGSTYGTGETTTDPDWTNSTSTAPSTSTTPSSTDTTNSTGNTDDVYTETTNNGTVNSNGGTIDSTAGGEIESPSSGGTVDSTTGGSTNPNTDDSDSN